MRNIAMGMGRFNPPTAGHYETIQQLVRIGRSEGIPVEVFVVDGEQSGKDVDKNPLNADQRVRILRQWFPSVRFEIASSALHALDILYVQNKAPAFLVAGSDRARKYKSLLGYAGFPQSQIVEADRSDGPAKGVSATLARSAARAGDFEEFSRLMPSHVDTQILRESYDLVRKANNGDGG